jgi:hypothetical protein
MPDVTAMSGKEFNALLVRLWHKTWTVDGEPLTGEQVVTGYHRIHEGLAVSVKDTGNGRRAQRARDILKRAGLIKYDDCCRWVRVRT